jgi:hypothetical protein
MHKAIQSDMNSEDNEKIAQTRTSATYWKIAALFGANQRYRRCDVPNWPGNWLV